MISQVRAAPALLGLFLIIAHLLFAGTQRTAQVEQLEKELRKPLPTEKEIAARNEAAKQKAQIAIRLLQTGAPSFVWPWLRETTDLGVRTYLIHDFAAMNINPTLLTQRLAVEKDTSARRALILSLGEFSEQQFPAAQRRTIIELLLRWYRSDPDPGIHAAIGWLLRDLGPAEPARRINWQQSEALAAVDLVVPNQPQSKRRWYTTRQGQTMVILPGPIEFRMGSPQYEIGRIPASDSPDEPLHRARISRSFAIANTEVTVAQFQRFLDANPEVKARFSYKDDPARMARVLQTFSPLPDSPQIAVTWYEAAMYCNWLSKEEGIPESEWVYPSRFEQIKDGMKMPRGYLQRTGYRLPTEAEWEYAARAGTTTARFFGNSEEMLDKYAWYSKHPPRRKNDPVDPGDPQRTSPVGQLKPNDFGLFDVYGNVWEWCQDRLRQHMAGKMYEDDEDDVVLVSDTVSRTRRGGAFSYGAAMQRSAERDTINALPNLRRDNVGFRVTRTYRRELRH